MANPTERVAFTRQAAVRISDAVRTVEGGNRSGTGLTFGKVAPPAGGGVSFRVCTFTGSWAINSAKTVTFKYQTTTPNTVTAANLFFPITNTAADARDCGIAKEGTAWFLVSAPMETATALFVTATQNFNVVTDVNITASLNSANCSITVGKSLVTTAVSVIASASTAVYVRLR